MVKKNPLSKHGQFAVLYLDSLLNLNAWIDKAYKLLEASKILEPQLRDYWNIAITNFKEGRYSEGGEPPHSLPSDLHGPYFILISYALENLFKALIIQDRKNEICGGLLKNGKLPPIINEHDLLKLAKNAHLNMNITEEDLLIRLYRQSKWKGRYPVPVSLSGMRNIQEYSDGKHYFTDYLRPDDISRLDALVQRVIGHVKSVLNPPNSTTSQ